MGELVDIHVVEKILDVLTKIEVATEEFLYKQIELANDCKDIKEFYLKSNLQSIQHIKDIHKTVKFLISELSNEVVGRRGE